MRSKVNKFGRVLTTALVFACLAAPVLGGDTATNLFENSLGMKFAPVPGLRVRFSIWETRVQDFQAFVSATKRDWLKPAFEQGPAHPAVNVSWEEASAFCQWLTKKERAEGKLREKQFYRLPTDQEWERAAAAASTVGGFPEDTMRSTQIWPWGHYWPPLPGDGNYAQSLKIDRFEFTAPVGSFKPNAFGLYDMGGNVWEWCEDWFNKARVTKTLRGGSYNDDQPGTLLTTYRFSGTMHLSDQDIGFRIVLEGE